MHSVNKMDLATVIETLEKELKYDDQRFLISNTRKADLLFIMKREIENFEEDLAKHTASLESIILIVAGQGCTSPLRRLTKKTLKSFLDRQKSTKVLNILIEFLKITQSIKSSYSAKSTCFDIIGFIYLQFHIKLVSPPTEEILESAKKSFKSPDNTLKKFVIKCINSILKSKTTNISPIASEFLKLLLKAASVSFIQEKQLDLRNKSAKGLIFLTQYFPNCFNGYFENSIQVCMKMMEDNNSTLPGVFLGEVIGMFIDTNLIGFLFVNPRKSLDQFPKTLTDVNYFLTQYMARVLSYEVKIGLIIAAEAVYAKFLKKSLVSANEISSFFDGYLNICAKSCGNETET